MPDKMPSAVASHAARELSSSTSCASQSFPNTVERTEEENCTAGWRQALYNGRSGCRVTVQSFRIICTEGDEEFYTVELVRNGSGEFTHAYQKYQTGCKVIERILHMAFNAFLV